jgi:hypothetical protein
MRRGAGAYQRSDARGNDGAEGERRAKRRRLGTLVHGYADPLMILMFAKLMESPKALKMLPYVPIHATRSRWMARASRLLVWTESSAIGRWSTLPPSEPCG